MDFGHRITSSMVEHPGFYGIGFQIGAAPTGRPPSRVVQSEKGRRIGRTGKRKGGKGIKKGQGKRGEGKGLKRAGKEKGGKGIKKDREKERREKDKKGQWKRGGKGLKRAGKEKGWKGIKKDREKKGRERDKEGQGKRGEGKE